MHLFKHKIPVILSVAVLALAVVLFVSIFFVSAVTICGTGSTCKLAGWLFSENYGFISLNSDNVGAIHNSACTGNNNCQYAVSIDSAGNISGYGWSENIGWVCFGDGNGSITLGCVNNPPFGGNLTTKLDSVTGQIAGVAKIVSMGDNGWIKLGTGATASNPSPSIGEECYNCYPQCDAYKDCVANPDGGNFCANNHSQVCDVVGGPDAKCGCQDNHSSLSCQTCFAKTSFCNNESSSTPGCPLPVSTNPATNAVTGGSGQICKVNNDCHEEQSIIQDSSHNYQKRIFCNQVSSCERYGFNSDLSDGQIVGWGWGGDVSAKEGAGWVQAIGKTSIVYPWLQTSYGSIYTPDAFRQKAQITVNNATYCLFANNATQLNFNSANCSNPVQNTSIGFLTTSTAGNQTYYNALGLLDVNGLMTTITGSNYDKYGYKVSSTSLVINNPSLTLNNTIYVTKGDLTVGGLTFKNGNGIINGNGTIIVNGDLHINGNLYYDTSGVADGNLKNLPSVAWIVKGDVIIDKPDIVTSTVGAFLVLGSGAQNPKIKNGSDPDYPSYQPNKSGVFFSGSSASPLTVLGMIAVRAFDFERTYSSLTQGSERIIYDGRLIANPPPGLKSFSEGLPVIRDFSY
jgi:hypothetical protein